MKLQVPRTCTVIHGDAGNSIRVGESLPLSELRFVPAYVLLGDPGAGKTTAFRRECEASEASGTAARYKTARDFVTFDVDSDGDPILFIDGLDETRVASTDARSPLDRIRNRLDRLRLPGFRISCREADWLGLSDQQSLSAVSPDSRLTVVRLDPLDETSIREILGSLIQGNPQDLVNKAKRMGVWPLLENPLTLELLAGAVEGGGWPESRLQLFEMACEHWLVGEHNPEHQVAAGREPVGNIMDAAGYLCALQLLAGIEGFVLSPVSDSPSFEPLNRLDSGSGLPLEVIEQALATRLFTEGATGFRPHHRHIAEFLAGRYLAKLVDRGLPARRVTALMASPSDGRVVTELRGLSAWIAAYPGEARTLLIDADPVGVGLYGDIGGFHMDDKSHLLSSLASFAAEGTLLGHGWRDGRETGFRDNTAWSFRSLASAEMVDAIRDVVRSDTHNRYADRVVEFVVRVVSEAPDSELPFLAPLAPDLDAIVRDTARSSGTRLVALDAYLNVAPSGDHKTRGLMDLLKELHRGDLADPDDELRGTLLKHLYPDDLSLGELWAYASPRNNEHFAGRFWMFWNIQFVEQSADHQVAYLLDTMGDFLIHMGETLETLDLKDIPLRLLARSLEAMGDDLDITRLYRWLGNASPWSLGYASERHQKRVRAWLEERPDKQKQLVIEWLKHHPNDDSPIHVPLYGDELHGSKRPADLGKWCLEQARTIYAVNPTLSKQLFQLAFWSTNDSSVSQGLSLEMIDHQSRGLPEFEKLFAILSQKQQSRRALDSEETRERDKWTEQQDREQRQRTDDWQAHLREHESELRSNTFSPQNLHTLALVYSGDVLSHHTGLPQDNIADFIGGDWSLVDAVMSSLRDAVFRDDLPSVDETISLRLQSQMPWLTAPVLVSMDLLDKPEIMAGVTDENRRRALALYYCFPAHRRVQEGMGTRSCHATWLDQDPGLVTGVLYKCATAALRDGAESLPGVNDLDGIERRHDVAQGTRLRLLEAFPTRLPSRQLRLFDELLKPALAHFDQTALMKLATEKLAKKSLSVAHRIRWMTVDALISGGKRTEQLRVYASATERRTRLLAEFLHNTRDHTDRTWIGLDSAGSELVACLIELLGRSYGPQHPDGLVTVDISTSDLVSGLISRLGSMADTKSIAQLASLVDNPLLARWRERLQWAQEQQRVLHRDTSYSHADIEDVQRALNGGPPANVADLAALLSDRLKDIRDQIGGDSSNLWRQFWNVDSYGRPTDARPEESCRDVLLELLRARLPVEVDVTPEGRYAADNRADIRVFHDGYNVPIEIKKNGHRDLWSALQRQLIGQYTTDPATSGYGIYLVFWFGSAETKPPPDGPRPATAEELLGMLESDLTAEQARKVSVIVMDVTKPIPDLS